MPPEQAAGDIRKLYPCSDAFGLGAILCVILTGRPPYQGTDAHAIRIQAVRGELASARAGLDACGTEPDLVAVCKRCLAFQHAEALKLDEESLALRKAKLGPDHPDTLMSMFNLSVSYLQGKNYTAAEPLLSACQAAVEAGRPGLYPYLRQNTIRADRAL